MFQWRGFSTDSQAPRSDSGGPSGHRSLPTSHIARGFARLSHTTSAARADLPGITLAWVTTLEVLSSGNYLIGNCHAGPGQPLLVEVEPKSKRVVWKFDQFESFGNSVSNSKVLD